MHRLNDFPVNSARRDAPFFPSFLRLLGSPFTIIKLTGLTAEVFKKLEGDIFCNIVNFSAFKFYPKYLGNVVKFFDIGDFEIFGLAR